jgi:hypothetical protein
MLMNVSAILVANVYATQRNVDHATFDKYVCSSSHKVLINNVTEERVSA